MQRNRRNFLKQFAGTAAATMLVPTFVSGRVLGKEGVPSPNNRVIAGIVGIGSRGPDLIHGFCGNPQAKMIAVCDCYRMKAERAQGLVNSLYKNEDCEIIPTYEEMIARKEIDVIVIATPDHWHTKIAIEAMRGGKDVYSEKPLTLTLEESRQIVAAARKYNRVATSGSQRVMEDYGYMAPVIQSGAIGQVTDVFVGLGGPGRECYIPEEPIPEGFDWDRWLGQAPWAPYSAERCSGSYGGGWRNWCEYGNGFLADWGAHKFGGAMYVTGTDDMVPVKILPPKCEENPEDRLTLIFPNGIKMHHASGYDITFVGTEGTYVHEADRGKILPRKVVELRRYSGGATNIIGDFLYCVYNRLRPFQDFNYGAKTAAACQMANIGYKLNRPLTFDPVKWDFVGDDAASRMVSRPQRAPYTIEV
ncbi:MAG: Gfo/Idh/MocA family oxidoreductase [Thermoguttaceae bacterium]|nr:Gfo/Idh/MocA family oxidoreductase [Thermoguttaceae bacterium]